MDGARIVSLRDVDLFVREMGTDGTSPPLVVLHGGPDWDHTYLLPGLEPIARRRRVVMFDKRGCGRSTRGLGPDGYQPELVVEDLFELIHFLGHEVVDLLGFSTGGQVAQLFVEAHPRKVRRLVLASTTAYGDVAPYLLGWPEYERRLEMSVAQPAWARRRSGEEDDVGRTVQWALEAAPTALWNLSRLDDYLQLLERMTFSGEWGRPFLMGRLHAWRPASPEQVLRDFGRPTLVLHGAYDMTFPVQVARRLCAAVPNSSLNVIDQAGHMAHFERPGEWSSAVLDFLGAERPEERGA
ncbi:pimeloyl-ACP methyl ester carboxylesterase [Nocardioides zeae]|uniref:Pimeloyl-ACP methyl ester carboxylesterase n=1 Tax=Nocardioides zeae TaxID=1457234 RepID=A0ACC6IJB3_9ACTN|nr:alpha/beta hydrolase [Nocardioides zeae]MDR6173454.1 pimeloyl-ACP methyl ester carboxylesterase [Nocardioides zeae]MDR6210860.1 pimeloyl-ACP methyl ester carboxylesterase [Nocardioides zeae]